MITPLVSSNSSYYVRTLLLFHMINVETFLVIMDVNKHESLLKLLLDKN